MLNAIKVGINQTTRVELRFNTAGNLNCIDASAKLSAPTINVLHYVEEPARCSVAGEYWFVHYRVGAHIYDDAGEMLENPSMGEVFERTGVCAGWGTATFDDDGNWSVYPADKYDGTTGHPGMAEHRHNLVSYNPPPAGDDGYNDPSDPAGTPGTVMGGRYVAAGSKIIMYFPDGGFIEGGLSSDCNTFVGTNFSMSETDLVYAVRKKMGHAATFPDNRKYVMCQPRFDIHYEDPGTLETDRLSFDAEFSVLDSSVGANKTFNWRTPVQFTPNYVATLLDSWNSTGPEEQAEESPSLPAITIGTDGLITGADIKGLAALGAGGSGVYGGKNEDFDPASGDHCVTVGFVLDAHTAPSLSDLAGTWVMGMIEGEADEGDGGWDSGDEQAWFGMSLGELTVDVNGNVTGNFVHKGAFTGEIENNPVMATISGPVDECYKVGGNLTDSPCTGITLPVFIVTEGGAIVAKIALDRTKNVISIWNPVDDGGYIYDSPEICVQDGTETGTGCGDASPRFTFGLGVKVE